MSRDFTRSEKILILILALILVGLAYYQFEIGADPEVVAAEMAELLDELKDFWT